MSKNKLSPEVLSQLHEIENEKEKERDSKKNLDTHQVSWEFIMENASPFSKEQISGFISEDMKTWSIIFTDATYGHFELGNFVKMPMQNKFDAVGFIKFSIYRKQMEQAKKDWWISKGNKFPDIEIHIDNSFINKHGEFCNKIDGKEVYEGFIKETILPLYEKERLQPHDFVNNCVIMEDGKVMEYDHNDCGVEIYSSAARDIRAVLIFRGYTV